uniref:NADH-ubiquinone oxidoreductase chain 2 n=1 Tax=Stenus clavicornis TaxID=1202167 RepID=A0A191ZS05_9COLE|nr:NADH dehydrogenase subunit 2 [Stenus clavicornis]
MIFFNLLIFSALFVISSNSWSMMWIGLEVNMLSIIPLMNSMMNSYSTESAMKYFIIQALSSSILLMSVMMLSSELFNFMIYDFFIYSLNLSLLLKMGMSPFHFWYIEMIEGLNWMNCMIMMIWQKMSPMIMIFYNSLNYLFFSMIICMGLIFSGIIGINQISMRKILAFSSINHMSWMLSSLMISSLIWMYYFLIYSILSMLIIFWFNENNIFFFQQLIFFKSKYMKLIFSLNFLAMGGLPPFIGFFSKWIVIHSLIQTKLIFLSIILVMCSMITLYFYMRLVTSMFLLENQMFSLLKQQDLNVFWTSSFFSVASMSLITLTLMFNFF